MASISPTTFLTPNPNISPRLRRFSSNHLSRSSICRCQSSDNSSTRSWDSAIQDVVRSAIKSLGEFVSGGGRDVKGRDIQGGEEWDWERWKKHFDEVDEQERVLSVLKLQLADAVNREDYGDASRLKVAIAAAATNDAVSRVMSTLNRAVEEERYQDAAIVRDVAGAGLVGWWSGISEGTEPHGVIIRISAEHGRYLARSYSPRQLAADLAGLPLFEIFLTSNKRGEYKQQAVYLKKNRAPREFPIISPQSLAPGSMGSFESTDKTDLLSGTEDASDGEDDDDDSDIVEKISGFDNVLRDIMPVVKVKVLKVTAPGKVDPEMLSKMVEQTIEEEEDEEKDSELESADEDNQDFGESDSDQNGIDMDAAGGILDGEGRSELSVKVVVGDLEQNLSDGQQEKNVVRVPARLEKRDRFSFSFFIENDDKAEVTSDEVQSLRNKKPKLLDKRHLNKVMSELAKSISRGKLPTKVLKDISELISLSLNQSRNLQVLSGSTMFNRIEISSPTDPLNGLYIGTHGLYTTEVIHLRRKFGQWNAEGGSKEHTNLDFYEYVEAMKLTGDPFVPAGQVAFRAKIGKRYQLPLKGIIPEEFGVIARYKGQGRLAEQGYKKPRWVDGELLILDGKHIKGGPVVGFMYSDPGYQFLVFFNRLRLQD